MGDYIWELRNPDGGMLGMEVARSIMAAAETVLAHALPERVEVEVRDQDDNLVASGADLKANRVTPMARLCIRDGAVQRDQVWPEEADLERPVILPGGEVGILKAWWNASDGSEWRWQ